MVKWVTQLINSILRYCKRLQKKNVLNNTHTVQAWMAELLRAKEKHLRACWGLTKVFFFLLQILFGILCNMSPVNSCKKGYMLKVILLIILKQNWNSRIQWGWRCISFNFLKHLHFTLHVEIWLFCFEIRLISIIY